eukprot:jgi/Undpi1/12928/HiC_scaffold_7.g02594.m1
MVRSGGVMAARLRPLLDALDDARGVRATGAAAMKILEAAEKAGWEGIRFSALRMGKIAAGAAVAGCWEPDGRALIDNMEAVGVDAGDVSSWTAVLLPLSRLGCADECLEVLDIMEAAVGLDGLAGRHTFSQGSAGDRRDELITVAHNHCMFAFIKAGSKTKTEEHTNPHPYPTCATTYTLLQADTYTYVSAMKALGSAGQWEAAVSLLSDLRDVEGVAPDVYVYTAAISACSSAGRWEEALTLEADMRRRGIKPNAYTVTSCISALARGGEWERAIQELEAAEEEDLPVSTPAYNAALKAFAIGKALQPGLDFFHDMKKEGKVPLDEKTHNIAIELCKECGDTRKAVEILRKMEAAGVSFFFSVIFRAHDASFISLQGSS